MCIRDRTSGVRLRDRGCSLRAFRHEVVEDMNLYGELHRFIPEPVSYTHLRAHETVLDLVCRLLLAKKHITTPCRHSPSTSITYHDHPTVHEKR